MKCAECGKPLDGESRFWCREHYTHLGTFRLHVTPETMAKTNPPRDAFRKLLDLHSGVHPITPR